MTLKTRSRSPKSNHLFPPSWWCICASLVKFQPLVEEIVCTQMFYCIKKFYIIYHIIIRFWLTCRYRGNIHISGPPSRKLACYTHDRSHTRSPGMSIMRVDSWELPPSAIPLCQLPPCHLWPTRPMLSIDLYVKGCLDCTIGAFHMSIPSESSLLQN